MNFEDLEKLFTRASRLRRRLDIKEGKGTSWSVRLENGETHKYFIAGVKPPEEVQDDIEGAFVWLWSLKDHVKKFLEAHGKSSRWVETDINADQHLSVCGDIANRTKHGGLDRGGRSGSFPNLGKLKYQIPQEALSSIKVGAFDVGVDVSDPKLITLEMPVITEDGKNLGNAFKYLDYALNAWERIIEKAEKAV